MNVTEPGIYAMPEETYHADPCPAPSLSASIAKRLLQDSPRHAWTAHPRLNPLFEPEQRKIFDLGKAAHALMLGSDDQFEIIDASDYKTKAAQAARDDAYAAGKTPILVGRWAETRAMVAAGRQQLHAHQEARDAFTVGKPEQVIVWREGDMWCRSRLDWLPHMLIEPLVIDDYKSTGASAHPNEWGRRSLFDLGYDIQAAFYIRGVRALTGLQNVGFRFVVQETEAPYALSVIALTPATLALAERKVEYAIELWRWCLTNDRWPGYPNRTCYIDVPPWHESQWLGREEHARIAAEAGDDLKKMMIEWQRPTAKEEVV